MGNTYAGDIDAGTAWEFLSSDKNAVLVDVRTLSEWQTTGVPNLESADKQPVLLSWRVYPNYEVNPDFLNNFEGLGIRKDAKILLMCKAGGRSREAAIALTTLGYQNCFNLLGGMEDNKGWMASGLPIKGYK